MRTIVVRATFALAVFIAVSGVAIRATGGWTRFQERIQPFFQKGPHARLIARTYAPLNRWFYRRFAPIVDPQAEDEVLDVGCGSGVFLRDYAAQSRRIAGLDQSEPAIEEALRQNRERVDAGTAEFVIGDAAALPWEGDEFTLVTSNCVDCFGSKTQAAIEEMYRVLKPGGRAVLSADYRDAMEAAGFRRITTERFLERVATTGYKE